MEGIIGEIRMFAGNFAPQNWAFCNGQLLSISQNTALFSIVGTTYGGDGRSTFALPNLLSRVPVGAGQGQALSSINLGQLGGTENVTLNISQIPSHNHILNVANGPGNANAAGAALASNTHDSSSGHDMPMYNTSNPSIGINNQSITAAGGNQPHSNMQPYLGINFIICIQGLYPSRN